MKKFSGLIAASILASSPAFAEMEEQILVTNNIRAGTVITAADIKTPKGRDALRRAHDYIGKETRRSLYKGQAINDALLREPTLIERNAIVQMEYVRGPMTISSEGRALDKGALGDRVRVMNLSSKRIVTVVVTGADQVKAKL